MSSTETGESGAAQYWPSAVTGQQLITPTQDDRDLGNEPGENMEQQQPQPQRQLGRDTPVK
jgi:hypothetical protein